MRSRNLDRMSALEFAALRPWLRNDPDRVEAARLVLVDGMTHRAAGEVFGLSRQNVTMLIAEIDKARKRHLQAQADANRAVAALLPPGWARETVVAPRVMLEKLMQDASEALQMQAAGGAPAKKKPGRSRDPAGRA